MPELHDLSALELGRAIAIGELSSMEVTEHFLARVERLNPQVGAFVLVHPDRALEAAKAVTPGSSPLAGVPTGIKDLDLTAGVRTTMGSAAFREQVPDTDAPFVGRIFAAGAVSMGKTATPEFGLVCYTEPEGDAACRTPWDLTRAPSGSSGGGAAAVAAGMAPWAPGGDGGGSIRTPAAACGIVGLKPSRGRIGQFDPAGFSVKGPLTRTVADAAAALDIMAGPFATDMDWAPPPSSSFLSQVRPVQRRLRIARYVVPMNKVPVDQSCIDAVDAATAALVGLGHEVVEIACPFPEEAAEHFLTVWASSASALALSPAMEEQLRPITRWFREKGRGYTVADYQQSLTFLRERAMASIAATAEFDVVMTPCTGQVPRPIGGLRNDADPAAESDALITYSCFTPPYNVSGQPGMSLPLHWDAAGLPIGVQIIGRPYDEVTLLQLAAELEEAMPWRDKKPPIW